MSLGSLLNHIWKAIGDIFHKADKEVKEIFLPVAIQIVNGLKTVTDIDKADIIGGLIGKVGPQFEDKLRTFLPKLLTELHLADNCLGLKDTNAIIQCALDNLHLSSDMAKDAFYHSISALLLKDLSDGKLSWSECVELVEFYYHNQKEAAASAPTAEPAPAIP
ncbi:MAG: hypothetical protein WKG06_15335 [Segetibacter sp.]